MLIQLQHPESVGTFKLTRRVVLLERGISIGHAADQHQLLKGSYHYPTFQ